MVGSLAVTPLRFTGDFLTALAAADDQRGIAAVLSGGTQPGSFGYASAGTPRWVIVCARSAAATDEELAYLAMACDTALVAAAHAARVNEERTAARTGRALVELGQALALEHGEDR